jgi:uncharacterized membrane protein YeaQ/YmgE (transglycosylase-associated protein family)
MNGVGLIGALIIGVLAGWIAEQVTNREHGLVTNLIVGVVGAFLGAFLVGLAGIEFAVFWGSLIVSTIGAIVLLLIVSAFKKKAVR